MKTTKLSFFIGVMFVVSSLLVVSLASAEDSKNNEGKKHEDITLGAMKEDKGEKRAKEVRNTGSTLEVHIFNDGKVLVRGAKVTGVSGRVISANTILGSVKLEWAINTDSSNAKFIRKFGGVSDISEVSVGDLISFHGQLVTTIASPFTVNADVVKDWSIQKKEGNVNGTVKSVDSAGKKFVVSSEDKGDVTVLVASSTVIKMGDEAGVFSDITVGAKLSARGVLNTISKEISATGIKIHIKDKEKTVMGGALKSIAGTTAPTTLVMTSEGKDYTVKISGDTSILSASWLRVALSSFVVGDKIQVYGLMNADMTIDATVLKKK